MSAVFKGQAITKFFKDIEKADKDIIARKKAFAGGLGAIVFADVIRHFEKEAGPKGKWKDWSETYSDHMQRKGRGGNLILQNTGRLRNTFKPQKWRKDPLGLVFFNDAKTKDGYAYAAGHNYGDGNLPQRKFMWLSKRAAKNVSLFVLSYLLTGKTKPRKV